MVVLTSCACAGVSEKVAGDRSAPATPRGARTLATPSAAISARLAWGMFENNATNGRRVYSGDPFRRSAARGSRAPLLPLERPRGAARTEVGDTRRGGVRRRELGGAHRGAEASRDRPDRAGPPSDRAGRAQPGPQPRARAGAAGRTAPPGPARGAQARPDEADRRGPQAATGGKAASRQDQALAATTGRLSRLIDAAFENRQAPLPRQPANQPRLDPRARPRLEAHDERGDRHRREPDPEEQGVFLSRDIWEARWFSGFGG